MVGFVSNVIADRRFGFIAADNGQEYFFHESNCESDWNEIAADFARLGRGKVQVTFEPTKTAKGPRADAVTIFET
ncbi:MAG: cold shock domain-containing protein [Paenisporosarcina sp.]